MVQHKSIWCIASSNPDNDPLWLEAKEANLALLSEWKGWNPSNFYMHVVLFSECVMLPCNGAVQKVSCLHMSLMKHVSLHPYMVGSCDMLGEN